MGGYGSRGWEVSGDVLVGLIVVAQVGWWGGVQEAVNFEDTSWWGTKDCSRGGIIRGTYLGTVLMDAVGAPHSVVVIAVLATSLQRPT